MCSPELGASAPLMLEIQENPLGMTIWNMSLGVFKALSALHAHVAVKSLRVGIRA